ncbi:hypothetical protein [Hydrogenimonas urashimensis]|uniref:hypothetical protein n=1 Tax=Hydrogenimonas urashimensis TaxID=2740515 RepID=UPI0019161821|nr:hypothetical protein [Hydrogenimonas urashimensis]
MKINQEKAIKIILLFSLINISSYYAFNLGAYSIYVKIFLSLLMNISGILLIIYFFKLKKKINKHIHLYFKTLLYLSIFWGLITIMRSLSFDLKAMMSLFGNFLMGWTWLMPLAYVFGAKLQNWIALFGFLRKLLYTGTFLLFSNLIFPLGLYGILKWLKFWPVFLMTYPYQTKKNILSLIISLIAFVIASIWSSQRTNALFLGLFFIFFTIEYLRQTNNTLFYKKLAFFLIGISFAIIIIVQFNSYINGLKKNEDLTRDTRTFVVIEMLDDMSLSDEIIGRGAMGTFFSPYFYRLKKAGIEGGDAANRQVNEVGFMHIVLKGGYIMLFLWISILLPASFLGILRSKNIISKMSGYYILSYLLTWFISYAPFFSPEFILLWMATGTCISKKVRETKNEDFMKKINGKLFFNV